MLGPNWQLQNISFKKNSTVTQFIRLSNCPVKMSSINKNSNKK